MSNALQPFAFAVQSAFLELLDLVNAVSHENEAGDTLAASAEKTVLRFMAALILADGSYRDGENLLVSLVVDWRAKAGGEIRYLNEYAARWAETSKQVPDFFKAAVEYDSRNGTTIARAMLREIQLIGNNVCACDARCGSVERGMVKNYLFVLETFLEGSGVATG